MDSEPGLALTDCRSDPAHPETDVSILSTLSANAYLAPAEMPAAEFAAAARAAGFDGVAWNLRNLKDEGAEGLRVVGEREGLAVTSLNSAGYFTWTDPDRQALQDAENAWLLEAAARLGAHRLVVIAGGIDGGLDAAGAPMPGGQSLATARARVAEGLARLDRRAAELGIRLALEPIHPVDQLRKGCVNAIADALALIAPLGEVDLALDAFHSAWDPAFHAFPAHRVGRIGLLQLCNWTEPHGDAKPWRVLPDEGRLDLSAILRGYAAIGYVGPVEFEMFDIHRRGRPVGALLAQARVQLGRLCDASLGGSSGTGAGSDGE